MSLIHVVLVLVFVFLFRYMFSHLSFIFFTYFASIYRFGGVVVP